MILDYTPIKLLTVIYMSNMIKLQEIDCIFLSYDEPNAEYNYADLLSKAPWAKRVHGIKGSDAAHKACADASDTEHFLTIDGDNIVNENIFRLSIDFSIFKPGDQSQLSWSGRNHINGLIYGNGGVKCWTREHVWNMRTHEAAADDTNQVDFCWNPNYLHMDGCYSTIYNNASPLQAFRAGFREGVKMCLLDGLKLKKTALANFRNSIPEQNYQRLLVWCSVGHDIKNGEWAVYGARLGCYMTNLTDWDFTQVRDFDYLNRLFAEQDISINQELGEILRRRLQLPVADLDSQQSTFFKTTYQNMPRSGKVVKFKEENTTHLSSEELYDIVFISNGEPNAEENYQRLKQVATQNRIHRVDNVQGIYEAHRAAADVATTKMFYVVDADAWIVDGFHFDDNYNQEKILVYNSLNPLNYLCYGYGGVKLFPKTLFSKIPDAYVDMTTSLGETIVIPVISCVTQFNTGEFDTWRSAFRECAKLSSRTITTKIQSIMLEDLTDQGNEETIERLNTWTTRANGAYADFCLKGAQAGKEFGEKNKDDPAQLSLINNYEYLKVLFQQS
jgi:hypothetical protein